MKKITTIACTFCAALLAVLVVLPGCATLDSVTGECAGATVVGAGAGGLAGVLVGDAILEDASEEVRIVAAVGSAVVGAFLANRACSRANAQRRELEAQFAAVQAELDSLRATQNDTTVVAPPPPRVEVVQVKNEETNQTEAVMTKVEFGHDILAFDFNSDTLPPTAPLYLRPLAHALADDPNQQVLVVGHTDNVGSAGTNLSLSEFRAQSVADFLVAEGISRERMQALGAGEYKPIVPNDTPLNRALNRRVEVYIIHQV